MNENPQPNLNAIRIQLGEVVACHGLDGGIKVLPTSDHSDRWATWLQVVYADKLGDWPRKVLGFRRAGGLPVLRLDGIDDRTAAETVMGSRLWVHAADLPPLPEDHYYWYQLVGLEVIDAQGKSVGRVLHVHRGGAQDVLQIEGPQGKALAPMVKAWIRIDMLAQQVVLMQDPDWS